MQAAIDWLMQLEAVLQVSLAQLGEASRIITFALRFVFPVLATLIFVRCLLPLLMGGARPRPLACLVDAQGGRFYLRHWENTLGCGKHCDVALPGQQEGVWAVITRTGQAWSVIPMGDKPPLAADGQPVTAPCTLEEGGRLTAGGIELLLAPVSQGEAEPLDTGLSRRLMRRATALRPGHTLTLILLFQFLGLIQNTFATGQSFSIIVPLAFFLLFVLENAYAIIMHKAHKRYIEPELLAFFLCGIGMFVLAAVSPRAMFKQFVAILLGLVLFLVLTFFLNNLQRARTARYVFAAGALLLLVLNLALAQTRFGARNWIQIGSLSLQPSEFVKVAFVFAGAGTLDRLLTGRNLLLFGGYSLACMGALGLMRDFGTALVFFTAFLVIAFMRSGNVRTMALILIGTAIAGVLIISFMPYIGARFESWLHAWDFIDTGGYQQTRTMTYLASGGLLGVGSGQGYLRYVVAADTDLVFGLIAEEWGLIVALICALVPLALAVFSVRSVKAGRSAFYAIAACGASAILLAQAALNVFGSVDILPLTGVTLPFVSNGGSSMMACWGLLACIKSIDERHRAQVLEGEGKL